MVKYPTPGALARKIEPTRVQTPALDILDQALVDAYEGRNPWLIFTMPPQEGKSERVSRTFPVWCLQRRPDWRVAIISYADALAMRWGRQTRNDISGDPDLGLAIAPDIGAAKEWQLDGHRGGIVTAGIGAGLTGRPVDVLIIDDPLKDRKEAESPTTRETCMNFWRSVASTRLPERSIVVLVMTRWHEDDMAGFLLKNHPSDFKLINIPAQAEHVPDGDCQCGNGIPGAPSCLGSDVLGRVPGEYMASARNRSVAGWELKKRAAGSYDWQALYQGRPSPPEGGIFKRHWWRINDRPRAVERSDGSWFVPGADEVIISLDAAFKDKDSSDFVCFQVWSRRGPKLDLVDQICERMEFTETCATFINLIAKWTQASLRLIESKANGPAIVSALRNKVGGLVEYEPKDSKEGRARAVSPFVEAGDIGVPDPQTTPWAAQFMEQCAAFPNGANDDMVDAFTQAAIRLLHIGEGDLMEELLREQGITPDEVPPAQSWSPQDPDIADADPDEPWM